MDRESRGRVVKKQLIGKSAVTAVTDVSEIARYLSRMELSLSGTCPFEAEPNAIGMSGSVTIKFTDGSDDLNECISYFTPGGVVFDVMDDDCKIIGKRFIPFTRIKELVENYP